MTNKKADIGLIGLAVMGQNLALNMGDHGYTVAVYNRTIKKVDLFLEGAAKGFKIVAAHDLESLVSTLKTPRKIVLMIKAGSGIDQIIDHLIPLLEKGDILIDGGNSHYIDTERRFATLEQKGILFVGAGISGGEEGARHGPSIMPGGNHAAWPEVKPILQAIAAKSEDGTPCCQWVGKGGAGHYVKMVHNGIEYGDMQIICESYQLLSVMLGLKPDRLSQIFAKWNQGELNSYLIEITSQIFAFKTRENASLVEKILDVAEQKGTGMWTVISALELGIPITLIAEAVFARYLSSLKEQRVTLSHHFKGPAYRFKGDQDQVIEEIRQTLYASKIISYVQGFMLIRAAGAAKGWRLDYGAIALMWRGGCIIRSQFLNKIKEAFDRNQALENLMLDDFFKQEILKMEKAWRRTVSYSAEFGIPVPCFNAALAFFDGQRSPLLPANLLQAQRDFFGAHKYRRCDRPKEELFHTDWTK